MNSEMLSRYYSLKKQQKSGVMLPREDFLFVKGIDQTMNGLRKMRSHRTVRDTVIHGYRTNPR